jgi:Domain of unknown function (DUF6438)
MFQYVYLSMKHLILLFFLLALTKSAFPNKIDSLKTDKDVSSFIISLDTMFRQKNTPLLVVKSTNQILSDKGCGKLAKKIGVKNWVKTDFNNDKLTDLLAVCYWGDRYLTVIVIDKGHNQFQLTILNYSDSEKYEFSKTIHTNAGQLVLFYTNKSILDDDEYIGTKHPTSDTLVYKFGHFVELNKSKTNYKIDSILFHSGKCYGSCPNFTIKLNRNRDAVYIAGDYSSKMGTFKSQITAIELNEIENIIAYIHVKKLKNRYSVNWTDDATCTLTVKFSDGTVKQISDYGERGTFGLKAIYSIFFTLTSNQDWR